MSLYDLPVDLPVPSNNGECDHLPGMLIPSVRLESTYGGLVDVAGTSVGCEFRVVYCYPMTGRPNMSLPPGWDDIPGARGCTLQAMDFETNVRELKKRGADVVGVSVQSPEYQREVAERLHLSFPLLSDENRTLANALRLPTFEVGGMTLLRRVTLVVRNGLVEKVFYPIFPPDRNASDVIAWLARRPLQDKRALF